MKSIDNNTEFVVILSKDEIEKLMACCNAASIRWHEKAKKEAKDSWAHLRDMSDECWHELYYILHPKREV